MLTLVFDPQHRKGTKPAHVDPTALAPQAITPEMRQRLQELGMRHPTPERIAGLRAALADAPPFPGAGSVSPFIKTMLELERFSPPHAELLARIAEGVFAEVEGR